MRWKRGITSLSGRFSLSIRNSGTKFGSSSKFFHTETMALPTQMRKVQIKRRNNYGSFSPLPLPSTSCTLSAQCSRMCAGPHADKTHGTRSRASTAAEKINKQRTTGEGAKREGEPSSAPSAFAKKDSSDVCFRFEVMQPVTIVNSTEHGVSHPTNDTYDV